MQILDQHLTIGGDAMNQFDLGRLFGDHRFKLREQIVPSTTFP